MVGLPVGGATGLELVVIKAKGVVAVVGVKTGFKLGTTGDTVGTCVVGRAAGATIVVGATVDIMGDAAPAGITGDDVGAAVAAGRAVVGEKSGAVGPAGVAVFGVTGVAAGATTGAVDVGDIDAVSYTHLTLPTILRV